MPKHGCAPGKGHSQQRHPLYARWVNLRQRCRNPNHPRYSDYGGRQTPSCPRGIWFARRWDDFAVFAADVGAPPGGDYASWSLDRIDNDGPYAPGNVRWATAAQQRRNQYREPWPFGVLAHQKDGAMPECWTQEDDEAFWDRWARSHPEAATAWAVA